MTSAKRMVTTFRSSPRTRPAMGGVYGAGEAEAELLAEAPGDPLAAADPLALGDALKEIEGRGLGVGSGKSLVGIPRKATTKISTKTAVASSTQGAASRSLRGGREPRYPSEDIAAVYRAPRMAGMKSPLSPAAAI